MLPQEPQCLAAPCAASSAWWCAAREARGLPGAPRRVPVWPKIPTAVPRSGVEKIGSADIYEVGEEVVS